MPFKTKEQKQEWRRLNREKNAANPEYRRRQAELAKTRAEKRRSLVAVLGPRECVQCRRMYTPLADNQLVCGSQCRTQRERARERERTRQRGTTLLCTICGNSFIRTRGRAKTCGPTCSHELMRLKNRLHHAANRIRYLEAARVRYASDPSPTLTRLAKYRAQQHVGKLLTLTTTLTEQLNVRPEADNP